MTTPVAAVPYASAKPIYLAALTSGALLYCSFFPLNLGFLAWIALAPLLFLIRSNVRPRHIYLAAFLGGLSFYVPAIQWMHVAHAAMYATWITLSIYSALLFPLGIWLVRKLDRAGVSPQAAMPVVWVGLEYFRAHFPTGFPWLESLGVIHRIGFGWYFLGYTQHDYLPMVQIADLAGVYGVSMLIVFVNTVVFYWIASLPPFRTGCLCRPWRSTVVAALLIAATATYGYVRLEHLPFAQGPRVALLQSNLPQEVKMDRGAEGENEVDKHMMALLRTAINTTSIEHPDLIVWPETTFSVDWLDVAPGVQASQAPAEWQREMAFCQQVAKKFAVCNSNQLLGLNGMEWEADGEKWKYNSAKFIDRDGNPGPRYDKMHLVPFGEYVPLRKTFPWMKMFTPYKGDYSCKPGEHYTRFPVQVNDKTYQFGCLICYEDSDPGMTPPYLQTSSDGPPVDFLVNISNDGWFKGTEEHEQHLAICRFRAIECRRSIVRAVNMGISGIIDADGRIVKIPGATWPESKKVKAVVNGIVPIDHRLALYCYLGEWLPLGCWGFVLVALLRRIRRPSEAYA